MNYSFQEFPIRIGVLSDTHIPDRITSLHPDIIPAFKENHVQLIIHAGDIAVQRVIDQLKEIAPVIAVKGNRDIWRLNHLPGQVTITINRVRILITHGHGNFINYILEKFPFILFGYKFDRFLRKFNHQPEDFDIVIFGHTHRAENRWVDGRLYFNPGSAYDPGFEKKGPSIGVIEIGENGRIDSKIIQLQELKKSRRKWVDNESKP